MNIKNDIRPWGSFRQFTENEPTTIKIIHINAGQCLSLQYHNKRSEFWVVLSGNPTVVIGDKVINASEGEEFFVLKKTHHRIEASNSDVRILEVAFGDFDEDDIVRIEDVYGRVSKNG